MKIVQATEIVMDLAAQQWGLVTSAQAGAEGVNAVLLGRLVDRAVLTRIRSGVYAAEATPWSPATNIRAQWLALEPKTMAADRASDTPLAVVSHESAAELHGIGDLDSNGIHFTVATRRQTRQPEVVFHLDALDSKDWVMVDGLPVTTPVRTVLDLANAGHEPDHLVDMIGNILQERLATRAEILDGLAGNPEVPGQSFGTKADLESWLDERFPPQESSEEQILRQRIDAALGPALKQMRTLVEQMTPSATLVALAQEIVRNSHLYSQGNTSRPGTIRSEDWASMAAKIMEHNGTFSDLPQSWAAIGNDLGESLTAPPDLEGQLRKEDDKDTGDSR
ncbi:hypothetical protein COCCU_00970 [Corynebacterium occultum]|uniref:Uncharacterized protein n=1 Tax=Corynebacterium occultum TaxID=2675219 RepID=A0A6B8VL41_9CORY|nr:type IV toxin-antitoxin system AbiEi family antitoxin domain-containing protein [Corynebacterium occultum]QGU06162.1 hypothetical protein COCCU_00970 [Corynebacterium occultum]